MRLMRAGAGFLVTVAVVAGPPAAALVWWQHAGWPWPCLEQLDAWAAQPLSEASIAIMLGLLATALWLTVALAALIPTMRQARRAWQRLKQMPVPTPAQATATSMAGAAVFGVPSTGLATTASDVVPGTPDRPAPSALHHPVLERGALQAPMADRRGVDLPDGGWLPERTAQAVTIAATIGWLRRRRDYQPGAPSSDREELHELPHTVTVIQDQAPADGGDDVEAGPAVLGQRGTTPLGLDQLPPSGVGLSGPGAADAARGVLITALLFPGIVPVVTTRDDITHLLGDAALKLTELPCLHVAGNLQDALDHLNPRSNARTAGRTVLVTTVPQQESATTGLRAALSAPDTTAVLLGTWPHGANRRINPDGTTTSDSEAERWCVLSLQAAADLCVLAAHASGSPSTHSPQPLRDVNTSASTTTTHPKAAVAELALTVLGPPTLTLRGASVHLRRSAAMQALVLLAVHRDGVTARKLGKALWPAEGPHATSSRVYTTMSALRRTLTDQTGVPVVNRDSDRYRLDPDHIGVDLWDLEDAVAASSAPTVDGRDRATAYRRVIDGYTGELAAGHAWPWLEPHRERLRHHVLDAYITPRRTRRTGRPSGDPATRL